MNRILADKTLQSNTPASKSTTLIQNAHKDVCMSIITPERKLSKAALTVLSIINFFTKADWGHCDLRLDSWGEKLVERGYKKLGYRQMIRIWKSLREQGYIESSRINGDRNKRNLYKSTILGESLILQLSTISVDKSVHKKMSLRESIPLNDEKCHFEESKMSLRTEPTPININILIKHDHAVDVLTKEGEEKEKATIYLFNRLKKIGFNHGSALNGVKALNKRMPKEREIMFELIKPSRNPGGHMHDMIKNPQKYDDAIQKAAESTEKRKYIEFDQSTGLVKQPPTAEAIAEYSRNIGYHQQMEKYKAQKAARASK